MRSTAPRYPARAGSVLADELPAPAPLSSSSAQALMRAWEADPRIDATALDVLRAMLFGLSGWRAGACEHALAAIATRAKRSLATVKRKLAMLEEIGAIARQRRARLSEAAAAGWRGATRWVQATTRYTFHAPEPEPEEIVLAVVEAAPPAADSGAHGEPDSIKTHISLPSDRPRVARAYWLGRGACGQVAQAVRSVAEQLAALSLAPEAFARAYGGAAGEGRA